MYTKNSKYFFNPTLWVSNKICNKWIVILMLPMRPYYFTYYYNSYNCCHVMQVLAFTRIGDGVPSRRVELMTNDTVPSQPRAFAMQDIRSDGLRLTWMPPLYPNSLPSQVSYTLRSVFALIRSLLCPRISQRMPQSLTTVVGFMKRCKVTAGWTHGYYARWALLAI